ncbi:hypothetical protein RSA11_04515 [Exiguobacterium indicum]|uniref:Uncharacterized protein n=1 Tax=Exiguobacterium indicum TaxID=296995 RepID=A0AAW3MH05_9BACL|nr:hypothetical protein [Exiguobacterium indicum]KTR27927.1 hypothetical protein RSA11_04515 [Exiguobacterium indicum]
MSAKQFDVRKELLSRPNEWVGAFQLSGRWLKVGFRTDVMYPVATPYWEDSIERVMPQAFKDELDRCIPIEDVPEEERT